MANICPDCQVWEILPTDNFCSFCRRKFINIGLSLHPSHIPVGEIRQISLVIHNLSDEKPIQVNSVQWNVDWVNGDFSRITLPFSLLPKCDLELVMFADTDGLKAAMAEVRIESNAGNDTAQLGVLPASEVRLEAERGGNLELVMDDRPKDPVVVRVHVTAGNVTLQSMTAEPAGIFRPVSVLPLPAELRAGPAPLEFPLRLDQENLKALLKDFPVTTTRELSCHVSARFCDPFDNEFERAVDLTVRCWDPPQMTIWEEDDPEWEGCTGEPRTLRLTIQNDDRSQLQTAGRAPLQILGVKVVDLSGAAVPWINLKTDLAQPLSIASGQAKPLEFEIFPEGAGVENQPEVSPGERIIRFAFATNLFQDSRMLDFRVIVREAPVFDGVLAIDFGTSNTCVAYLGRTDGECVMGKVEPADRTGEPTKSPTLVQFLTLEGDQPVTDYGSYARSRLGLPQTSNAVVQSVKRLLGRTGESDRIAVQFSQDRLLKQRYLPREVTTLYLKHVRKSIEKSSGFRFQRIAVTHPARFKLSQIEDLKQAVRASFGDVTMTCYQEPIAAGLEHILAGSGRVPDTYTLGVFDCGGGTTDLSLIRVERSTENSLEELTATLLASTGKWFGGEDLTIAVRRLAREKLNAALAQKSEGILVSSDDDRPELRSFARLDEIRLWEWAEELKLELLYSDRQPTKRDVSLRVLTADGLKKELFHDVDIRPESEAIKGFLRSNIGELASMLQSLATAHQIAHLDTILLSGMTSSIPQVRDILQERFPDSEIVQSRDPKRCVAMGACYLDAILWDSKVMRLKVHGRAATVSRIGFADRGLTFALKFLELIPAGVPIPDEGLRVSKTLSLHQASIVDLMENDADGNSIGNDNPNITLIGRFRPDFALPTVGTAVEVELCVTPDLECSLFGRLAGSQESFGRFVRVPADRAKQRGAQ